MSIELSINDVKAEIETQSVTLEIKMIRLSM